MNCKTVLLKDLVLGEKGSYGIGAPAVDYDPKKYTYLRITDINDDGTADYDIQNDEVILNEDINVPAKFTFQLTGPKGGEWIAYFVKEGGVSNAFTLNVEGDDSRDVTCQGKVGEGDDCIYTIEVRAKGVNNTSVTNKAELRFMIRQAGQLLPVEALTTLSGSRNYKILQNPPQQ